MKKQTKVIEYNLEASEFNWEIAPGKKGYGVGIQ
jgi:hypothetical protein